MNGDYEVCRVWYGVNLDEVLEDGTQRKKINEFMNQNNYLNFIKNEALQYIKKLYFDNDNYEFVHYTTLTKNLTKEEAEDVSNMVKDDDKLIFNAIRNNEYYEFLTSDYIEKNSKIMYKLKIDVEKPHNVFCQNNYQVVYLRSMRKMRRELQKMINESEYKDEWELYLYHIHNVRFV